MSTAARYLRFTVNGTVVKGVRSWRASPAGTPRLDASDADSAPYTDTDAGLYGVDITLEGIWDPARDGPYPGFLQGAELTEVVAYSNRNNATADYRLPLAMVADDAQDSEVNGQIVYRFTCANKGIYYRHGVAAAVS